MKCLLSTGCSATPIGSIALLTFRLGSITKGGHSWEIKPDSSQQIFGKYSNVVARSRGSRIWIAQNLDFSIGKTGLKGTPISQGCCWDQVKSYVKCFLHRAGTGASSTNVDLPCRSRHGKLKYSGFLWKYWIIYLKLPREEGKEGQKKEGNQSKMLIF